jgi:hypothetical protein
MKIGKVLAVSAVSGILVGTLVGCGDKGATPPPTDPAAASGGKASCSGAAPASSAAPAGGSKASCSGKGSCSGSAGGAPKAN